MEDQVTVGEIKGLALVNQLWLNEAMLAILEASHVRTEEKRPLRLGIEQSGRELAAKIHALVPAATILSNFTELYPRLSAAKEEEPERF